MKGGHLSVMCNIADGPPSCWALRGTARTRRGCARALCGATPARTPSLRDDVQMTLMSAAAAEEVEALCAIYGADCDASGVGCSALRLALPEHDAQSVAVVRRRLQPCGNMPSMPHHNTPHHSLSVGRAHTAQRRSASSVPRSRPRERIQVALTGGRRNRSTVRPLALSPAAAWPRSRGA